MSISTHVRRHLHIIGNDQLLNDKIPNAVTIIFDDGIKSVYTDALNLRGSQCSADTF